MEFQENFLHAVWKYQYFDKKNLHTTSGQTLEIKKIGFHNLHEGPDFLEAQVRIGNLDHYGHIEIHKSASDWMQHAHGEDEKYKTVILHVVFKNDCPVLYPDGNPIPTLELEGKIFLNVIKNYELLVKNNQEIPCSHQIQEAPPIIKFSMLEKALVERLETRSQKILEIVKDTGEDWEETTYRWMFYCFGFKVNAESMLHLASLVPFKILQKQGKNTDAIEAILLGQAGLLNISQEDEKSRFLYTEYIYYQKKYGLNTSLTMHHWKFMGVRPSNYPYQRIAQISQVVSKNPSLFSSILDASNDMDTFREIFQVEVNPYWQDHSRPGVLSKRKLSGTISKNTLNLLVINLITPLWYTYGKYLDNHDWKEKCFDLLQQVAVENNAVTRKFDTINWKAENAFDSQGMLGLYQQYCLVKKCLDCKIGQNLLKPPKH